MSKRNQYIFVILFLLALSTGLMAYALRSNKRTIGQYSSVPRPARIRPDYCDTVIPANIAPLNFIVQEDGSYYYVKIFSIQGRPIELFSRSPKIVIPQRPWHRLLDLNKTEELYFDIYVKTENGQWRRFSPITNKIAAEPIDGFLVYRKLHQVISLSRGMGIYQRNLENYDESIVLDGTAPDRYCVNCHTFLANKTDNMLMHIRGNTGDRHAMLLIRDGEASNIDSRTQFGAAPMGHTAWHPSGKLAVFTIYKVRQFFHTARGEVRDVVDLDSAMGYYLFESRTLKTTPKISQQDRLEPFPTFSPDGRYLYFCVAPILWSSRDELPPQHYKQSKYSLVRISYDLETDTWGQLETVLSAEQTGLSIIQPRISPDGRFLLFCMCQYSGFPAFQANSDLYLIDLKAAQQTGRYEYRRLDCNSDQAESWHCWSSNSRWFVFSSKRQDAIFARSYFSYVDENGTVHKPFLLAQKDPAFYDSAIMMQQLPELVTTAIPVTGQGLARLLSSQGRPLSDEIPVTSATPKAGTAVGAEREPE